MNVVAKFRCVENAEQDQALYPGASKVRLEAVTSGPGNESWSKWTPSGRVELWVTNPAAVAALEVGRDYLLTFEAAP
jgi:hypothetical protein